MAPSRVGGQFKSVSGTLQRAVGTLVRAHGFAGRGRDRHNRGVAEVKAAKARGYASGTGDRARGKGHSILGGITGNRARQARGNALNDKGSFKQWGSATYRRTLSEVTWSDKLPQISAIHDPAGRRQYTTQPS